MAGADYYNCDSCGKGKIFYDANVDWEGYGEDRLGQVRAICKECFNSGVRIQILNAKEVTEANCGVKALTENRKVKS